VNAKLLFRERNIFFSERSQEKGGKIIGIFSEGSEAIEAKENHAIVISRGRNSPFLQRRFLSSE